MLVELNIQMNILWLQNKQLQCSEIRSAKPCEMSHDNREDQCKATSVNAINTGLLHRFGNILRQQLSIKEVGRPQQKSQQAFFMENLWEEGWVLPLGTKSSSLLDSLQQLETTASAACVSSRQALGRPLHQDQSSELRCSWSEQGLQRRSHRVTLGWLETEAANGQSSHLRIPKSILNTFQVMQEIGLDPFMRIQSMEFNRALLFAKRLGRDLARVWIYWNRWNPLSPNSRHLPPRAAAEAMLRAVGRGATS